MERLLARVSKALGIPDEEIDEALAPELSPESEAMIEGAEEALRIAKGGCVDCGEPPDDSGYQEIAKRTFTAEERRGARFSIDGRFPMNNCSDVSNARQALGRAKPGDRPRIEALIRRAAAALKCNIEGSVVAKGVESNETSATVEGMDESTTVEQAAGTIEERVSDLETQIEELPAKIVKALKPEGEEKAPTAEDLSTKLDKLASDTAEQITKLGEAVEALGEGGSAQAETPEAETVAQGERIEKAFKDRDLDPRLAGLLS